MRPENARSSDVRRAANRFDEHRGATSSSHTSLLVTTQQEYVQVSMIPGLTAAIVAVLERAVVFLSMPFPGIGLAARFHPTNAPICLYIVSFHATMTTYCRQLRSVSLQ